MKRSKPLERKTRLKAKRGGLAAGGELARTRLSATSKKRRAVMAGPRGDLNAELRAQPRVCEVGEHLRKVGVNVCTGRATCWHERRKRNASGSILNRANVLASCWPCNQAVESEAEKARSLGTVLVLREGDPEWDEMCSRNDRSLPGNGRSST